MQQQDMLQQDGRQSARMLPDCRSNKLESLSKDREGAKRLELQGAERLVPGVLGEHDFSPLTIYSYKL